MIRALIVSIALIVAAGCATQPMPAWKQESVMASHRQAKAYLTGQDRAYRSERDLALAAAARSGRIEEQATLMLFDCALRVASLDLSACEGFDRLALNPADVSPAQIAYRQHLYGASQARNDRSEIGAIQDPLSRLVTASVLLQKGQADAAVIALAVETASEQGWPRPLLAWLHAQKTLAQRMGDSELAAKAQRRIDLLSR